MNDPVVIATQCEAVLFASARSWSVKKLADALEVSQEETHAAVQLLAQRLEETQSALQVVQQGNEIELVTRGEYAVLLRQVFTQEAAGELSRPSLETLAILAYRGPLTRPELEQIRGVQCAMILRNLSLRGLIEQGAEERIGQPTYQVTIDFLKHLGLSSLSELPDFQTLHHSSVVEDLLQPLDEQLILPAPSSPQSETEVS